MKPKRRAGFLALLVLAVGTSTINNLISGSNWSKAIEERSNISVDEMLDAIGISRILTASGNSAAVADSTRSAEAIDFEIIVLTMNRVESLRRLLTSLENAEYGSDRIRLTIQIDLPAESQSHDADVVKLASTFPFTHGPKVIQLAHAPKGLRAAWLEAWNPPEDSQHRAIIFEDDLEASPMWYQYVKMAWELYGDRTDMAGISLNRQALIPDESVKNFEIVNNHEPFFFKLVGSQGFSPHPKAWRRFLEFCETVDLDTFAAEVPGLITTKWYSRLTKSGMWTQLFIYFCEQHNLYNLYINLPAKKALVSHWRDKGVHFKKNTGRDYGVASTLDLDNLFPANPVKYGWDGAVVQGGVTAIAATASESFVRKPDDPYVPPKLERVGTEYGGWTYDASMLTKDSIVYSVGLGEDTSWDEGIIKKHGLQVWGCDPTPKSHRYVHARQELKTDRFHLIPEGLSLDEGVATFTLPENPDHVSMRQGNLTDLGGTVDVKVNRLENWMAANNYTHLSICKMDIEGSEYDVLEDWIKRDFFPMDQLLVKWHFQWLKDKSRQDRVIQGLQDRGWYVAHSQNGGQEQLFLRVERKPPSGNKTKPVAKKQIQAVQLETTGSVYGGWTYNAAGLNSESIVYSIGLGEDTSWDEGIMEKHGVQVFGFDPTPKSVSYIQSRKELATNLFHFTPEGLGLCFCMVNFTLPADPEHVSVRLASVGEKGKVVSLRVNLLENWMKSKGHMRLSILKMDVEGSEYDIIEQWIETNFFPMDQLLVEWHFRWLDDKSRHDRVVQGLLDKGWYVAHSLNNGQEQTFLRSTGFEAPAVAVSFDKDFTDVDSKTKLLSATKALQDKHGVVAIQLLNEGYLSMTKSWICNVKGFPGVLDRTLFIATDKTAYDALVGWDTALNIIHVDYKAPKNMSYGQYSYYAFMLFRTRLICCLLANDITLWLIESDAVWLRDPSDEVLSSAGDMITMSDGEPPKLILQGGFQVLRPTKPTINVWLKLLKQFARTMERFKRRATMGETGNEQLMLNRLIRVEPNLKFTWLDPKHFLPGIYYRNPAYAAMAVEPKVILNNYIVGNAAKIERAKLHGHWFLNDDGTCDSDAAKTLDVQ